MVQLHESPKAFENQEVIMPFCPDCQAECGAEALQCASCGAMIRDRLGAESEESAVDGDELVELAELSNSSEAEMIAELLENNGIRTVVRGEVDPIGLASRAAPPALLVERRQLLPAQKLYEAFYSGETSGQTVDDNDRSEEPEGGGQS